MPGPRRLRPSITRRRSIRPAPCVTLRFTDPTSIPSSSSRWSMATGKESKPKQSRQRFRRDWTFPGHVTLLLFMAVAAAWSQQAEQGIDSGNYNIKQSVEFGYRFTDVTGNQATYDTFVNLQQGPRLLDMTLEMRSLDHHGLLFDRLYM